MSVATLCDTSASRFSRAPATTASFRSLPQLARSNSPRSYSIQASQPASTRCDVGGSLAAPKTLLDCDCAPFPRCRFSHPLFSVNPSFLRSPSPHLTFPRLRRPTHRLLLPRHFPEPQRLRLTIPLPPASNAQGMSRATLTAYGHAASTGSPRSESNATSSTRPSHQPPPSLPPSLPPSPPPPTPRPLAPVTLRGHPLHRL